jgi:PPOX class probable F420-dependent enzyme
MSLADEKYINFTTYKRDGTAVTSPVWVVGLDDGTLGFWTSSTSGKAKRLRNDPKVLVQPSDARGRPRAGTSPTAGSAVLATGTQADAVRTKIKAKYGFMVGVTKALRALNNLILRKKEPYGDVAVVITQS